MIRLLLAAAVAVSAAPLAAAPTADPTGDFLAGYTGPLAADLDVVSVEAIRNANSVTLIADLDGAVGTTTGGRYIWGVNRGAGTAPFAPAPGVLFDAVIVLTNTGTGTLFGNALDTSWIGIAGNRISVKVPFSLLPSTGFDSSEYVYNLWPRAPGNGVAAISDFAPDNSSILASVPEPASWALMISGFGLTGLALRRGRRVAA